MSPWEIIGWVIAIPFVLMAALFTFALLVGIVKYATRTQTKPEPKQGRHLKLVEDD
jgi:hypothetical protein